MKIDKQNYDIDSVIEMAWCDKTSFDSIKAQTGIPEKDIIKIMRSNLKKTSFKVWRERVRGRKTKHSELRSFKVGRHQSYDQSKHRKR